MQLERIVAVLREAGFRRALARTGDIAFFSPAARMYERCGFAAVASQPSGPAAPFSLTEYQLAL
jgi:hypothetical protein